MTTSIDSYLGIHATALTLRSHRAKNLANNMANADTPNYKATDIDFRLALQQSQIKPDIAQIAHPAHPAHIPFKTDIVNTTKRYRIPQQASFDGNTVDVDVERGLFTENAVRYQASLEFLNKKISRLIQAIRGE